VLMVSGSRAHVEMAETQLVERSCGPFVHTLTLPNGIDEDEIRADYDEGVLELHVPKPAEQRRRRSPSPPARRMRSKSNARVGDARSR